MIIFLLCLFSYIASGQVKEKETNDWKFKDRIYVGGGIQAQFGNTMVIGASPIVGYRITEKLSAGVGATYLYYRIKYPGNNVYKTSIYGGNVFTRYLVWKDNLFAHGEYGFINWEVPHYEPLVGYTTSRLNVPFLNLGGGYRQKLAEKAYFEIFALYDVLHGPNSFSPSPLSYRAGVNIGF